MNLNVTSQVMERFGWMKICIFMLISSIQFFESSTNLLKMEFFYPTQRHQPFYYYSLLTKLMTNSKFIEFTLNFRYILYHVDDSRDGLEFLIEGSYNNIK